MYIHKYVHYNILYIRVLISLFPVQFNLLYVLVFHFVCLLTDTYNKIQYNTIHFI
jgi:hypothetical protein